MFSMPRQATATTVPDSFEEELIRLEMSELVPIAVAQIPPRGTE